MFKLLKNNLAKLLTTVILLMGLWACRFINSHHVSSVSATNSATFLDENIRNLRTGDLVIKIFDSQKQPLNNIQVQLQQISHEFEFGTALSTEMFSANTDSTEQRKYLQLVKKLFNATVHENALKWYSTEPNQGQINYADADRILEWSEKNNLTMRGHTLFWAPKRWNQDWLQNLSVRDLRLVVQKRAIQTCQRYRGRIAEYDVLNEMLHGDFFQTKLGQKIVPAMFSWCQASDPSAALYVNDFNILNGEQLDNYVTLMRSLLDQGIPIGGIGVQGHIRQSISAARIKESLDTLAQFNLPIKITEFDAVADTEEGKARVLEDIYRTAFAHPAVTGIYMWGFWAGAHWEPKAAIFDKNWQPLPAAKAYQKLVYDQWWTQTNQPTDETGEIKVRAFFGDYQVTVNSGNRTLQSQFTLSAQEKLPKIVEIMLQ